MANKNGTGSIHPPKVGLCEVPDSGQHEAPAGGAIQQNVLHGSPELQPWCLGYGPNFVHPTPAFVFWRSGFQTVAVPDIHICTSAGKRGDDFHAPALSRLVQWGVFHTLALAQSSGLLTSLVRVYSTARLQLPLSPKIAVTQKFA